MNDVTYICTIFNLDAVLILSPALIANNPERNNVFVVARSLVMLHSITCYRKLMYLTTNIFTVAEIYQYLMDSHCKK